MTTITRHSCMLCGGSPSPHLTCDDFLTHSGAYHIVRCDVCGFLWTTDAPNASDITSFYDETYTRSIHPRMAPNILRSLRLGIQSALRARFILQTTRKSRGDILDVGCGKGDFLHAMQKRGWHCKGCELETHLQNTELNVTDIDALQDLPEHSFDVITFWHSLEHLHDVDRYLAHIAKLLKKDGICIIAVPNAASRQAAAEGSLWFGYDVPRHLWHFSPKSLTALLEKTGFTIEAIRPMRVDPFFIQLLMLHIRKRPLIGGALRSLFRDVFSVRTANQAPCILCIARPKQ